MIPDEAIEAACHEFEAGVSVCIAREDVRRALEAALPYLSEAARQPQRNSPTDWPDLPKASR